MMRIPQKYEKVVLTAEVETCTKEGKRVTLAPLTICEVDEVSESRGLIIFGLAAIDRPDLEPFGVYHGFNMAGDCYPFVAFPPNQAEAEYWAARVADAMEPLVLQAPDMTPTLIADFREAWNRADRHWPSAWIQEIKE
jgi:hypothetical protein